MSQLAVDEKDAEILRLLQEDCKRSVKDIGRKIDSPITTVYTRIKRLEDTGFILSLIHISEPTRPY